MACVPERIRRLMGWTPCCRPRASANRWSLAESSRLSRAGSLGMQLRQAISGGLAGARGMCSGLPHLSHAVLILAEPAREPCPGPRDWITPQAASSRRHASRPSQTTRVCARTVPTPRPSTLQRDAPVATMTWRLRSRTPASTGTTSVPAATARSCRFALDCAPSGSPGPGPRCRAPHGPRVGRVPSALL